MRLRGSTGVRLALFAVAVHGGVLLALYLRYDRVDRYAFESLDAREFHSIAKNLVEHGAFSQSAAPPFTPDTWRTPGYPLFLAAVMSLAGSSPAVLIVSHQILSLASVLLFFSLARRHLGDRWAGRAATIFLLEPYRLYYSLWLLSTTWFVFLLLLTWWVWERVTAGATHRRVVLLALASGLLVLTWPGAILIPVAVFFGLLAPALRAASDKKAADPARRLAGTALFALACSTTVGGWMLRNQLVAGHSALSHQGGIVLAYFKATEVELWRLERTADRYAETSLDPDRAHLPHSTWNMIDVRLRERFADLPDEQRATLTWRNLAQGNKTTIDSFAISDALYGIGWSLLAESPGATLTCCTARCVTNLTFPLTLAACPPTDIETNRLKSAALGTLYSLLTLAALVGLIRSRGRWAAFYFPVACTLALTLAVTPQIEPRFRVPLIPMLLFLTVLPWAGPQRSGS